MRPELGEGADPEFGEQLRQDSCGKLGIGERIMKLRRVETVPSCNVVQAV